MSPTVRTVVFMYRAVDCRRHKCSRHAEFGRRATVTLGTGHEASAD